jgi:CRISPR-associated protein Csx17
MSELLQVVRCSGIRADSLGEYLAGLGVLKAVSRRWPNARGCWREGCFVLAGAGLSPAAVLDFLGREWQPTKYERWWKGQKELAPVRSRASLAQVRLLDCHVVSRGARNVYNPVLGSGGNVGRRDFAQVAEACRMLRGEAQATGWLEHSLFGRADVELPDLPSTGTWFVHANKVFNSGRAVSREGQLSPWSYLFAMEGALLLAGSVNKRLNVVARPYGAFPFVTEAPAPGDAGELGTARAEFWGPDWERPALLMELKDLLQRGLARVGTRAARTPADFATAAMTAGAQAGLTGFHRFQLRQTTSGNTYESIGAGRVEIGDGVKEAEALQKLADWIDRLPRDEASQKTKRFVGLKGPVEKALVRLAEHPHETENWQKLLLTAADVQLRMDRNRGLRQGAPVLKDLDESLWRRGWGPTATGGSQPENLAAALALCIAGLRDGPYPVFQNIFGVADGERKFGKESTAAAVWSSGNGFAVLADLLERRLVDAGRSEGKMAAGPESAAAKLGPTAEAGWIEAFLSGGVDADEVSRLLPAFSMVKFWRGRTRDWKSTRRGCSPEYRMQALLRPLFLSEKFQFKERGEVLEPRAGRARAVLAAVRGGHWERAFEIAEQTYRSVSLRIVRMPEVEVDGDHIAASLLIPMAAPVVRAEFERIWMAPQAEAIERK